MSSSTARHQLSAASGSDKQKDWSTSPGASTAGGMDTASRVSDELVKQVEVNTVTRLSLSVIYQKVIEE